jgi:hypothetical protein
MEPATLKIRPPTCNLPDQGRIKRLMPTAFSTIARALLATAPLALLPLASMSAPRTIPVFLGNYADSIHAADFDPATGALTGDRAVAPLPKASFLARSGDGRFLYAVTEADEGRLHAFSIDPAGHLGALNSHSTGGAGPCDVALSPDGRLVAVANYSGGSVIVHRVEPDGRVGVKTAFFAHCHASKAVPERQEAPHAHGVTWAREDDCSLSPISARIGCFCMRAIRPLSRSRQIPRRHGSICRAARARGMPAFLPMDATSTS